MTDLHLTQRELDIMSVLWDLGEATVTEVRDRVDPDLAYTSISSMIRTLEIKGYVSHRRGEGKTHVYFPAIEREAAGESVLGRVLDRYFSFRVLAACYLWAAVCVLLIGKIGASVPALALTIACAGLGIIGGQNASHALTADAYPTRIRSTGVGWALGIGRIG